MHWLHADYAIKCNQSGPIRPLGQFNWCKIQNNINSMIAIYYWHVSKPIHSTYIGLLRPEHFEPDI